MGFYTSSTVNENFVEDIYAEESQFDPGIKGAMEIIAENEENYSMLMKAIGINELRYFEENGTEIVYEGTTLSGFFTKAKEFFLNILAKVKGLFKKFISMIDSLILSDKDFIKKYRPTLLGINTKDFSFKGYNFTVDSKVVENADKKIDSYLSKLGFGRVDATPTNANEIEKINNLVTDWTSNKESHVETMRGEALGKSAKLTSKEFSETLFAMLRGNEDKPVEITKVNVNDYISIITSFKEAKTAAQNSFKVIEKRINDLVKELNAKEKEIGNTYGDDATANTGKAAAIRMISKYVEASKIHLNITQQVQGMMMSALKQESRQAKAVCVRLVSYKPKNEGFVYEGAESALSGVVFK